MTEVHRRPDGSTEVTFVVPPSDEWSRGLDAARNRLNELERQTDWRFASLFEPSHSFGHICVLEKPGITHSMSGSRGLAHVVAGFGTTWEQAIGDAVRLAREWDEVHGRKEEARGYVEIDEA